MYEFKKPTRQLPGIFSYINLFSSKSLAYLIFFLIPLVIPFAPFLFNGIFSNIWNWLSFFQSILIYLVTCSIGVVACLIYSKKSPLLKLPPKGFSIQLNTLITGIIGGSYLFGRFLSLFLKVWSFREIFFMLGTVLGYIIAFVIYFSFTTVGRPGYLILALMQPVVAIILYSIYTVQLSIYFFIRAVIFFIACALLFAIPYARGLFQVSNVYKKLTGLGGYKFIRNFVLSMLTDGNDEPLEILFDKVGKYSDIKVQFLFIRNRDSKRLKGLFIIPHLHFGPFKTCGSSIVPEEIYREFENNSGVTVFHTTTDHSYNLTTKNEVKKVLDKIKSEIFKVLDSSNLEWNTEITDFSRNHYRTAKILGFQVNKIPIVFLTRHPYPSDDIEPTVGTQIYDLAKSLDFQDIISIDSHNAIIGDEFLISRDSEEANDLIKAIEKYLRYTQEQGDKKVSYEYSVLKDPFSDFSEKDGIGSGGMILHFFKNTNTNQRIVLIHFDGNNSKVEVRSYILNLLQNRGIDKAEITTSDSHTVARQFSSRGYSPIGDKIKSPYILNKLDKMIKSAEKNLEPVEFLYKSCVIKDIRIWGDQKYFIAIMETLQECINVSQRLLTLSLIVPTFFSIILLIFFYNFPLMRILPII